MINAIHINEELTTTGQVVLEQLQQAIQEGFKSVLNLRSPDELGFLKTEQELVEGLGLNYAHVPFKLEALSEELIDQILLQLEQLPKPVVVHCAAGMRSTTIALLSIAVREKLTVEETLAIARSLGFGFFDYSLINPKIKQFFVDYVNRYAEVSLVAA
ncbi:MAG TPA: protein tyrosine phosphatase family protein [Crinalium sp.]